MKTPEVLREVWIQIESRLRMSSTYADIFQLEAIGPLIALCTWPELLSGCLWIHFIDNSGAQSALINGSSSVLSGDLIAADTWSRISHLRLYPWFERVHTKSNPVDQLSRGDASGDWDFCRLIFPYSLKHDLQRHLRNLQPLPPSDQGPVGPSPDGGCEEGRLAYIAIQETVRHNALAE